MSNLSDLLMPFTSRAPLNEELKRSLTKGATGIDFIRHPLMCELYSEELNVYYNESLKARKRQLEESLLNNDLEQFIFLHARPFRMTAFVNRIHELRQTDQESLAELTMRIWSDAEWPTAANSDTIALWIKLFERFVKDSSIGREAREVVPDTLYRGAIAYETKRRKLGLSWTANKELAVWFAKRSVDFFKGLPIVYQVRVSKEREEVLAFCPDRNEEEFILDTTHLYPRVTHEVLK